MNATFRFRPSAISPCLYRIAFRQEITFFHRWPFLTAGFRLIQVSWLVFMNFVSLYIFRSSSKLKPASAVRCDHSGHGSRWHPQIPLHPLLHYGSVYAHHGQLWLPTRYQRSAFRGGSTAQPDVACSIPSMHGWHHHAPGTGSTKRSTNDLVRSDVHKFHFSLIQDGEVTRLPGNVIFSSTKFPLSSSAIFAWAILAYVLFFGTQIGQLFQIHLAFRAPYGRAFR
jgi:hypothetical protein